MDKKNTMLLTVIAVATLLVAVVGATFAYFSVTGSNQTTTTTGTIQTDDIGAPVFTTVTSSFGVYATASDMAYDNAGTSYYSTTTVTEGTSSYNTSATNHTIAQVAVSGGASSTSYTCTYTLTPTVSGTMATALSTGDAELVLSGDMGISGTYDLTTIATSYSGSVTVTGSTTKYLYGYLVLHNTSSTQNDIAGTTLTVSLAISNVSCDVD